MNILVTGGGGSIGGELCIEILKHSPLVENEEDGGNIEKEDSIESRLKQLLGEPNTSQSENLNEDSNPAPTLSDLENKGHIKQIQHYPMWIECQARLI